MIQKIQALQRRLIAKTEETVEKDMLIQVSARVCVGGAAPIRTAQVMCLDARLAAPCAP